VTDDGTALTIADAARASGTDRGLIRRKLQADAFPDAFKDGQGFWRIPADNLRAAGLAHPEPPTTTPLAPESLSEPASDPSALPNTSSELEALAAEVAAQRHRADKAEALLSAERRLNEELGSALARERRTVEILLEQVTGERLEAPEPRVPAPGPRVNWQAGLRAARARQLQERAARDRGRDRITERESGS
jgi:hypothetical protein